jgi:hypothetical protein
MTTKQKERATAELLRSKGVRDKERPTVEVWRVRDACAVLSMSRSALYYVIHRGGPYGPDRWADAHPTQMARRID